MEHLLIFDKLARRDNKMREDRRLLNRDITEIVYDRAKLRQRDLRKTGDGDDVVTNATKGRAWYQWSPAGFVGTSF